MGDSSCPGSWRGQATATGLERSSVGAARVRQSDDGFISFEILPLLSTSFFFTIVTLAAQFAARINTISHNQFGQNGQSR